jgi:hypothetical protein
MDLNGAAHGSGLTRWLGLFGAVVLAAGLVTAYGGVLRADVSSAWDYCGAGKTIVTVPCRCPEGDIKTTWSPESIACFSPAPDSASLMADLGSSAVIVGALLLAVGTLLRLGRVGRTWLVVRSALTVVASVVVAGLAALLSAGPPCLDCPSSPSDPAFARAAIVAGSAAVVVLAAALIPLGFHLVSRSQSRLKTPHDSADRTV